MASSMEQEPKYYKAYPEFTIKGMTFRYTIDYFDDTPTLTQVNNKEEKTNACGNP